MSETETTESGWGWYAGDGEHYTVGPEDTREGVIDAAKDEELGFRDADEDGQDRLCFEIIEARQDLIQIADHIRIERMVERWEENDWEEMTDPDNPRSLVEKVTKDQWAELQDALRAAAREWQARHAIAIRPYTFTQSRNHESVVIELADEPAHD